MPNWYKIPPNASVLRLHATENPPDNAEKYDFIISSEPERPGAEFFAALGARLAPTGRLLLIIENRFGLKYWCGTRGGAAGASFGELETDGGSLLFGAEIRRALTRAGFCGQKWYYPMPDHKHARAVYSENKLPDRFFNTISEARPASGEGVVLREAKLFPGIIGSGMFTFMCNSYIIEAAFDENAAMCPVDYAALTDYRAPGRAFITAVYSNGTAKKTALHSQGIESLKQLAANHARLTARGLNALPVTVEGDSAVMPAVKHSTLWEYMQKRVADGAFDREEFIRIFDRLREDIIKSSKLMPPGSHGWDEGLGPVQEYAYLELVPANCFYDKDRDMFIYFDQEHALRNCPYSIPLSRAVMAIRYSPALSANKEAQALMAELIGRYGLTACWDKLTQIEGQFIAGILNSEGTREYDTNIAAASAEISRNRMAHDMLAAATVLLKRYTKVGVYGYGKRGRMFCSALGILDCEPAFIADKNAQNIADANMRVDIANTGGAEVIVVTPKDEAEAIAAELREKTKLPVLTVAEIFYKGQI